MIGYHLDVEGDLPHQFSVLWETLDRCSKVWIDFKFVSDVNMVCILRYVSDIKGSNCAMLLIRILSHFNVQGDPSHRFCVFRATLDRFFRYESKLEFLSYVTQVT